MAAGNAVWGVDIGQCALKALRLRVAGDGKVEALAFDLIEHAKILSQSDADQDELIKAALEKFVSRNEWQGDEFVIGVPGQQTFARFCKMPPVDRKKIPDLVRFEASQQIPFDMEDVVWDYQSFSSEDSPDIEVGIFAMRRDLIRKHIDYFSSVGISPTIVQTIPSALYNFSRFERSDAAEGSASVIINVGAQNTDLVVVEPNSAWTRNIPLGGNNFTEALVRAFKLSFAKAESLKRTAATSKYARQIFQAMRPVFAELVAEIQRSIGFYSSTRRDVELQQAWALGNAFRLPGLQKYLENNLTIGGGVLRVQKFNNLVPSAAIDAPQFSENILTFAAAYGLALQGLGLTKINASLLPTELARVMVWGKKRPYFVAAAACLGLAAILPFMRNVLDAQALANSQSAEAKRVTMQIIKEARDFKQEFSNVQTNTTGQENSIKQLLNLREDKGLVPQVVALVHQAMPTVPDMVADVRNAEQLGQAAAQVPRTQRRQLLIDSLSIAYVDDIDSFELPSAGGGPSAPPRPPRSLDLHPQSTDGYGRDMGYSAPEEKKGVAAGGFHVRVKGRLLYGENQGEAIGFLTDEYYRNLRALAAEPGRGFYIPDDDPRDRTKVSISQPVPRRRAGGSGMRREVGYHALAGGAQTDELKDPVTGEDMGSDWEIEFGFKVKIGQKPQPKEQEQSEG